MKQPSALFIGCVLGTLALSACGKPLPHHHDHDGGVATGGDDGEGESNGGASAGGAMSPDAGAGGASAGGAMSPDAGAGGASAGGATSPDAGAGGAPETGGAPESGGAAGSGGTPENGGAPDSGGAAGSGGVPEAGGAPGTGGVILPGGGGSPSGGTAGMGGTSGAGGSAPVTCFTNHDCASSERCFGTVTAQLCAHVDCLKDADCPQRQACAPDHRCQVIVDPPREELGCGSDGCGLGLACSPVCNLDHGIGDACCAERFKDSPCNGDDSCVPTQYCAFNEFNFVCRDRQSERQGGCADDEQCLPDLFCGAETTCVHRRRPGESCSSTEPCESGSTCDPVSSICASNPALGEPCGDGGSCAANLACVTAFTDGTCQSVTNCHADADCSSSATCTGATVCEPIPVTCTVDTDCPGAQWCVARSCRPLPATGEPCLPRGCGPGAICRDDGRCSPPLGRLEACSSDDQCKFNLSCIAGRCSDPEAPCNWITDETGVPVPSLLTCPGGSYCKASFSGLSSTVTCTPRLAIGSPCDVDDFSESVNFGCGADATCLDGLCSAAGVGTQCFSLGGPHECPQGLTCGESGSCQKLIAKGQPCFPFTAPSPCEAGTYCDMTARTCTAQARVSENCDLTAVGVCASPLSCVGTVVGNCVAEARGCNPTIPDGYCK